MAELNLGPPKKPGYSNENNVHQLLVASAAAHQLEFIHAPPDVGFGDVDVALGVDVQRVAMREFAELMARPAELREFVALMIENMDELVAAIGDDHVFLSRIARKSQPPCRTPIVRRLFVPRLNPDVFLESSHLVEHLNSVALAIAHVYEALVVHHHAMHDAHELAALAGRGFILRGL